MEIIAQLAQLVDLVVGLLLIFAVLRLFSVDAKLGRIEKKLAEADKHRREEFEAMTATE